MHCNLFASGVLHQNRVFSFSILQIDGILCVCIQALLSPGRGFDFSTGVPWSDSVRYALQNVFAFSFVWSIGGVLDTSSRDRFDVHVRERWELLQSAQLNEWHISPSMTNPKPMTVLYMAVLSLLS